jgi:hypothetical protein
MLYEIIVLYALMKISHRDEVILLAIDLAPLSSHA